MCIATAYIVSWTKILKSKWNSTKRYKCKIHNLTPKFLNFMLANKYLVNRNLYNDCQRPTFKQKNEIKQKLLKDISARYTIQQLYSCTLSSPIGTYWIVICTRTVNNVSLTKKLKYKDCAKRYKCKIHNWTPKLLNFKLSNEYLMNSNLIP